MRSLRRVPYSWLFFGLGLALASPNTQAQIGLWQMEIGSGQTALDYAGPHHGVLGTTSAVESTDPTWTTSGFFSNCLQFDGDDLVTIANTAALQLTGDMTICASIYIDAFAGDWVRVVGKASSVSNRNYGLWYHPDGRVLFQIYGPNNAAANAMIALPIVTGQWFTLVGVRQGMDMRLYANGTQIASATLNWVPDTSTAPLTIGMAPIHTGHRGRIDHVALYDRALTNAEIKAQYSFLSFAADVPGIDIATGGTQNLRLHAGGAFGSKSFRIFGSATGTLPGIVLTGVPILLVPDAYTDLVMGTGNSAVFTNFGGTLNASGAATASLNVPGQLAIPVGFRLYHAFLVYDGATGQLHRSSVPVPVEFK